MFHCISFINNRFDFSLVNTWPGKGYSLKITDACRQPAAVANTAAHQDTQQCVTINVYDPLINLQFVWHRLPRSLADDHFPELCVQICLTSTTYRKREESDKVDAIDVKSAQWLPAARCWLVVQRTVLNKRKSPVSLAVCLRHATHSYLLHHICSRANLIIAVVMTPAPTWRPMLLHVPKKASASTGEMLPTASVVRYIYIYYIFKSGQ